MWGKKNTPGAVAAPPLRNFLLCPPPPLLVLRRVLSAGFRPLSLSRLFLITKKRSAVSDKKKSSRKQERQQRQLPASAAAAAAALDPCCSDSCDGGGGGASSRAPQGGRLAAAATAYDLASLASGSDSDWSRHDEGEGDDEERRRYVPPSSSALDLSPPPPLRAAPAPSFPSPSGTRCGAGGRKSPPRGRACSGPAARREAVCGCRRGRVSNETAPGASIQWESSGRRQRAARRCSAPG